MTSEVMGEYLIEIKQVIRRSDQGVTRPFVCLDEHDRQLWVKGSASLARDLAAEWLCAQLAEEFGLPMADFDLVSVPEELIEYSVITDIASLGSGTGFGSIHVTGASELDFGDIERVSAELRADVLLFDYWVQNDDRFLGEKGGNPNLLWQVTEEQLVMIDHNCAFDVEFENGKFFDNHVFGCGKLYWNVEYREKREQKLLGILRNLSDKLANFPEEWFGDDEIRKIPLKSELDRFEGVLRRVEVDPKGFWEVTA